MNKINLSAALIPLLASAAFASGSATIPNQYYGSKPEIQQTKQYPSKMHPAISRAHQVPAETKMISNLEIATAKANVMPSKSSSVKEPAATPSVKKGKPVITPTPPKQSQPIVQPTVNTAPKITPPLTEKPNKPKDNSQDIIEQSPNVAAVTTPNKVPVPPKTQVAIPQVEPIIIAVPKASSVETQVPQAKANKVIVPIAIPMETQIPQAKPSKVILPIAIPVETQVPQAQPNKVIVPTVTPVEAEVPIARPIKIIYPEANE